MDQILTTYHSNNTIIMLIITLIVVLCAAILVRRTTPLIRQGPPPSRPVTDTIMLLVRTFAFPVGCFFVLVVRIFTAVFMDGPYYFIRMFHGFRNLESGWEEKSRME